MSVIEWRKEFEVGVRDVDAEHRNLVDLINELAAVLESQPSDSAIDLLGEIHARIAAHFALEERLMRDSNYDQYAEHKNAHEALLDDLRDLMDSFESGSWIDLDAFVSRVGVWFSDHFKTHDARLHRRLG